MGTIKPPPIKHNSIPKNAQWLSGVGSGSWFVLTKEKQGYKIQRFSAEGKLECSGIFTPNISGFTVNEKHEFTYLSHCLMCTIIQKNQTFIFKPLN